MNSKKFLKWACLVLLIGLILVLRRLELTDYYSLAYLKSHLHYWRRLNLEHPIEVGLIYSLIYVLVTVLSIPTAPVILTLGAGALFGLLQGTVLVSLASTCGGTLAFLMARFFLREPLQDRFKEKLRQIDRGMEQDGLFYLLGLRLVPLFPFTVINLLMGLTAMRVMTFFTVSMVGMLPGTMVYVLAGRELGQLESVQEILSPSLIIAFSLIGLFPILARRMMLIRKRNKIYGGHRRPKSYDYNLVVIGGGAAGLSASYLSAALKARVALIEEDKMGGDCLYTGCVPSKALIRAAREVHELRRMQAEGVFGAQVTVQGQVEFTSVMDRLKATIETIAPHDSVERYRALGVDCFQGKAKFLTPWEVEVGAKRISTKAIIIATGARAFVPPIPGLVQMNYLTSATLWNLRKCPEKFLIVGGGPIGVEMAQAFARLGSQVTLVESSTRVLPKEDLEAAMTVQRALEREGVNFLMGHKVTSFGHISKGLGKEKIMTAATPEGQEVSLVFDEVLVAAGRKPHLQGMGLAGLNLSENALELNAWMETSFPHILAGGDVVGTYQFTHTASQMAVTSALNALFGGPLYKFKMDERAIPRCTFTDPEVAAVGLSEEDCRIQSIAYEVNRLALKDLDRFIIDGEVNSEAMIKVLTKPGRDEILGATVVAKGACELIQEIVLCMQNGIGLKGILKTIHPYPGRMELHRYLAGQWRRQQSSPYVLRALEKFHSWRRGS